MGFTEVTFELSDPQHPLCRLTRPPARTYAIVRPLECSPAGRHLRAHISFRGTPEDAVLLAAELRAGAPATTIETLDQNGDQTGLLLQAAVDDPQGIGFGAIGATLSRHGLPALVDPLVAAAGKLRVRIMIPREAAPPEIHRALQDIQKGLGFADIRITRMAPLAPGAVVEMSRRALGPDQEALLALAASMGYYATPKAVTLERIARTVGLSISPVHKKLKSAEETIVAHHMAQTICPAVRKRQRRSATVPPSASPWEVQVRARGDFGPANLLAGIPSARASLHSLPPDAARAGASLLVLVAPDDTQQKVISGLEGRPEIDSVALLGRSPDHAACRITMRAPGLYSPSWWHEAWGADGAVRSVIFERGEAIVRAVITRQTPPEQVEARIGDFARMAGWTGWEVEALRCLSDGSEPPEWPEPLTHRQDEVLRVAHALGYYKTPRESTLDDVAKTLDVSANAVHKNLVLAESKLISAYLAAGL